MMMRVVTVAVIVRVELQGQPDVERNSSGRGAPGAGRGSLSLG